MKSYKEIYNDIKSTLSDEITGTALDSLISILSMYVYNIQANAVSQLLEGNIDTATSINSIISKGAQYGVSLPRVTNPEVEFYVKSVGSSHTIYPGDEVISIGKFKFLFIGYYGLNNEFFNTHCDINPSDGTLIRCLVAENVKIFEVRQPSGVIYDTSVSNVSQKIFAYKDGNLMRIYDKYREFLADSDSNKLISVTYPDYGVKLTDVNPSEDSIYKVILPGALNSITELLGVIKGKSSSKYVTVSATRGDTNEQNIKIVNLGSDVLSKDDSIIYVENNLKMTQMIKSNSDINAFFTEYLYSKYPIYGRLNISYILGSDLNIYVSDNNFSGDSTEDDLLDIFYVGLNSIRINPGVKLIANIRLNLNNPVDESLEETISGYIHEYDGVFNKLIDEYDLVSKINSINTLIRITEFEVSYSAEIKYLDTVSTINLSKDEFDLDVPDLEFPDSLGNGPDQTKVYKLYIGKDKYLETNLEWI